MESDGAAVAQLAAENEFALPVLDFKKDFTPGTFVAEYAFDNNDIVYHFYPPQGGLLTQLWKQVFPVSLERVAKQVFQADFPRLKASYTEEMSSWWFRANGFVDVGDPDKRSQMFFSELDKDFASEITKARQGGL